MIPSRFQTLKGLKVLPLAKPPTADSKNQARRLAPLNIWGYIKKMYGVLAGEMPFMPNTRSSLIRTQTVRKK